ncbi:MAG: FliA/WhiG family RNA polymerase sigma factor [Candidatus Eisenbacteria bacterium]|uniref:FliA/WhiG family RNA polymerase sigma factor n=1 Tax=Eiseniibacteriota bacterium TaxID=2212470 RepID=A0A849SEZ7_UNCEI|nr:FliA/WhiG family RNA polymerase sigma factor [Candidatus Eisenbacteria bacterium]
MPRVAVPTARRTATRKPATSTRSKSAPRASTVARSTTLTRTQAPVRATVTPITAAARRPGSPRTIPAAVTYSKDELLQRFAPLVRHVVERIATTLPRNVDHEDLYSAGVLGLLDAHAKFDAHKGVKFETYAVWRIKGAVLDQLRALDWASRSMRRKARNLDGVTRKLDQKLGRAASDEEVAKEMRLSRADYFRLLDQVRGAVLVSLDETRSSEDQEPTTLADHLADPTIVDIEQRLADEESKLLLLRTLDHLPEQERLVVALYYYEHMTLKEIGRTLGISESRVSQVHTRAMSRLRLRLGNSLAEAA